MISMFVHGFMYKHILADSTVAYQVSEVQGLSPHPLPAVEARRGVPTDRRSPER